mmetsp:Transcript_27835/g.99071  ORF Transcript_27835/g.99071 Transcript_27835/m.99071 type:complete len:214 (-) Transcript_27835:1694-2335(-)
MAPFAVRPCSHCLLRAAAAAAAWPSPGQSSERVLSRLNRRGTKPLSPPRRSTSRPGRAALRGGRSPGRRCLGPARLELTSQARRAFLGLDPASRPTRRRRRRAARTARTRTGACSTLRSRRQSPKGKPLAKCRARQPMPRGNRRPSAAGARRHAAGPLARIAPAAGCPSPLERAGAALYNLGALEAGSRSRRSAEAPGEARLCDGGLCDSLLL